MKILKQKKKNKGHKNKAQLIIEENLKKREKELIEDDTKKLSYYNNIYLINNNIIGDIGLFKTEYGKSRIKYKLLEKSYRTENIDSTIELYLQIIGVNPINKNEEKWRKKVEKRLSQFNYKEFQFEKLSDYHLQTFIIIMKKNEMAN